MYYSSIILFPIILMKLTNYSCSSKYEIAIPCSYPYYCIILLLLKQKVIKAALKLFVYREALLLYSVYRQITSFIKPKFIAWTYV